MLSVEPKGKRLEVNETRMLRWMCGVTKKDESRNEHVRGSIKVAILTTSMISVVLVPIVKAIL